MIGQMVIKRVSDKEEIKGIKALQTSNLKSNLTEAEMMQEGFLTASYTLEFLEQIHDIEPAIVAKDGDTVVGYALAVTKALYGHHDLLDDLFTKIDAHHYKGQLLADIDYVVVGQLCVAKTHRGRGLVQQLYGHFQASLSTKYPYLITDVDEKNPRSVKAHIKTGFAIIGTLHYGGSDWHIVLWDWKGGQAI
jgi:ribosomal protein S18 acetylase RimI-like enzyme